ncbi:MAG: M1 family aminopeptidase [Gemmatimonadaceae bacterium]
MIPRRAWVGAATLAAVAALGAAAPRTASLRTASLSAAPRPPAADSAGVGWTLTSLALEVSVPLDTPRLRVAGTLELRAPVGGSFGPDLIVAPGGMAFEMAEAEGAAVRFTTARDTVRIRWTEARAAGAAVAVRFRAVTRRDRAGRSIAVGADGAFASWGGVWYPWPASAPGADPDLLASGSVRVTVPAAWHSLSNGKLVDSTLAGGLRAETWTSARELAWSIIAAPYVVSRHRVGSTDVAIYLMPRQAGKAAAFAEAIPPMVDILARAYGPYPFETFGLAALPASIAPPGIGGRSEQGYFIAHEHALDDDSVNVSLFAHELAHMWWPNLVDSRPPGDDMMDEGLASQGAALVIEAREGRAAAHRYLHDGSPQFSARGFFHIWRVGADDRLMSDYGVLPAYAKGPWVYEMLRDRVGDSLYFATLRSFAREHAGRSASLADLRAAYLRVAPAEADLERFFADWLDRPGAPVLDVTWSRAGTARAPSARVRIAQRTPPYRLRLGVAVDAADGARVTTVSLTDSVQTFVLPASGRPTGVRLDPAHSLLLWEPAFGPVPGVTPPLSAAGAHAWLGREIAWLTSRFGVKGVSVAVVDGYRVRWTGAAGRDTTGARPALMTTGTPLPLGTLATTVSTLAPARRAGSGRASAEEMGRFLADVLAAAAGRSSAGSRTSLDSAATRAILTPTGDVTGDPLDATKSGGAGFRLAIAKDGTVRISAVSIAGGHTAVIIGYPRSGQGCVILLNDDRHGFTLAREIAQRVAVLGKWPGIPGRP